MGTVQDKTRLRVTWREGGREGERERCDVEGERLGGEWGRGREIHKYKESLNRETERYIYTPMEETEI